MWSLKPFEKKWATEMFPDGQAFDPQKLVVELTRLTPLCTLAYNEQRDEEVKAKFPRAQAFQVFIECHPEMKELYLKGDEMVDVPTESDLAAQNCAIPFLGQKASTKLSDCFNSWCCGRADLGKPFIDDMKTHPLLAGYYAALAHASKLDKKFHKLANAKEKLDRGIKSGWASTFELDTSRHPGLPIALGIFDKLLLKDPKTARRRSRHGVGNGDEEKEPGVRAILMPLFEKDTIVKKLYVTRDIESPWILYAGPNTSATRSPSGYTMVFDVKETKIAIRRSLLPPDYDIDTFVKTLCEFAKAPGDFLERVCVLVGECSVCGRALSAKESRDHGIGPVCKKNLTSLLKSK